MHILVFMCASRAAVKYQIYHAFTQIALTQFVSCSEISKENKDLGYMQLIVGEFMAKDHVTGLLFKTGAIKLMPCTY